jgi:RimJ/RimL family protein N-acetyltransferase
VWPHNAAARRLYERAGFVIEGHRRRHWRRNSGQLWDSIEMSLGLDEESSGSPF